MGKIVDAFIFNNEWSLIDVRLNYLSDVVDQFVMVRGHTTFSGRDRGLMPEYLKKTIYDLGGKVVEYGLPLPLDKGRWECEFAQRNAIHDALAMLGLSDDDYVLMSDLDEIPDADQVKRKVSKSIFVMDSYWYFVNCLEKSDNWPGTIGMFYSEFKLQKPQWWREERQHLYHLHKAGWHFSYMGGLAEKLSNFAHEEYDTENNKLGHKTRIESKEILNSMFKILDNNLPARLQEAVDKHKEILVCHVQ